MGKRSVAEDDDWGQIKLEEQGKRWEQDLRIYRPVSRRSPVT
jgi:hypothetical protein